MLHLFTPKQLTIYLLFFLTSIILLFQGCFVPFSHAIPGIDVDIFVYCSKGILNGKLMYKDMFDHKGPVLYLMNVLGLFLFNGNTIGIWCLQIISLFITMILFYKIVILFYKNNFIAVLTVISSTLFSSKLAIGEDTVQEWSLPYISLALFLFIQYFKVDKNLSKLQLFGLSFSFVWAFLLQPNLIVVWLVWGSILIVDLMVEKRYKTLFSYMFYILFFVFLSLLPFLIYGFTKGIVDDFYNSLFGFNTHNYIQKSVFIMIKNMSFEFVGLGFLPILIIFYILYTLFYFKKNQDKVVNIALILSFFLSALFCSIGNNYKHYYIIYIPLLILPYAFFYELVYSQLIKYKKIILVLLVMLQNTICIYSWGKETAFNFVKLEKGKIVENNDTLFLKENIRKIMKENNIQSADKMLVFGNRNYYYLASGLNASSKYSYTTPIIDNNEILEKEYFSSLYLAPPKLFIYQLDNGCEPRLNDLVKNYLRKNYTKLNLDLAPLGVYGEVECWLKK